MRLSYYNIYGDNQAKEIFAVEKQKDSPSILYFNVVHISLLIYCTVFITQPFAMTLAGLQLHKNQFLKTSIQILSYI